MDAHSSGISPVFTWLIHTTLYVSILICLILLLKAITRKRLPAWWYYGLWLLLAARMVLPWVPESRLSVFNYVPVITEQNSYMTMLIELDLDFLTLTELNFTEDTPESSRNEETETLFWQDLTLDRALLLFWLAGMIVFGVAIVLKNLSFWLIIKKAPLITDHKVLGLLEICKSRMKIQTVIHVIMTDKIKGPALFGYLRPRLLLTEGILEKLDEDQLRYVFLHELGHLKRHDIAISWLTTLLQTIHWFNPLVWYAFYQMRVDQEAACDAYILSRFKTDQSTGYGNTIVGLLEGFNQNRQLPALVGILENKSQIKRRIVMITQNRKSSKRMSFMAASLLFALGFIFFTSAQGLSIEGRPEIEGGQAPSIQPVLDIAASQETLKALQTEREKGDEGKLPTDALKAMYEAQMLMQEDQFDGAIARLNEYLAKQPPDVPARVYMMLGNCLYAKENFEETRKSFEKAYEIDPTDAAALRNYAAMTYQTERFVDAAVLWEKLYEMEDPKKPRTLWQAAGSYYQSEDLKNSKRVLERLLRLPGTPDPQWYQLIIEVSYALGQKADVEQYIQEFLTLNPVQAYYWTLLSQIQLDKNDLLAGARSLEMAYSIQPPKNKNKWKDLAEIYLSVGEAEKAAQYFEKAGVTMDEVTGHLEERKSSSGEETFDTAGFGLNMEEFGFDLSQVDKAPRVIQRVLPVYPFSTKMKGIKAKVKIRCMVDKDGIPQKIVAAECDPEEALDVFGPPAVEAVKKWRFSPGEIDGDPVPTRVAFNIFFELPSQSDEVNP